MHRSGSHSDSDSTPGTPALPDHLVITESAKALAFLEPWDMPAILRRLMEKSARHGIPPKSVSHILEHPTHFIAGVLRTDNPPTSRGEAFTAVCASRARLSLKQMREIVAGFGNS